MSPGGVYVDVIHGSVQLTPNRSDLTVAERQDYIKAVLCLQSKPPKVSKAIAPGAKSRFDDFVAFHM